MVRADIAANADLVDSIEAELKRTKSMADIDRDTLAEIRERLFTALDSPTVLPKLTIGDATPEALAMTEEIRSTVNAAIESLPEDLRTAIVLRELEGLSYEEIAEAMGCPVGTVRSRIFRAREAIDNRLRDVFEGGLGRSEEL